MPPSVGTRFGRYELVESLGAGAMGEVYCARDHDLHRDVAVKFLPERFATDPERLARFAQEARAASSLNHPNIVTIHEIGEASGLPFIVMELVDGQTLRTLLVGRPLETRRLLEIGGQLAGGLAKAHAAGIVHRDLKPANVMVTRDGFAKILDFGLAKLRGEPFGTSGSSGSDISTWTRGSPTPQTTTGVVLGTAGYMSPEQARGREVDFRSDQFALGVILYEMATGAHPFRRESPVQTLAAIIEDPAAPVASLNPAAPPPLCWIVERCLAKDPAERYASTSDLARELQSVREHLVDAGSHASDSTHPSGARPAPARIARAFAFAAALLVLVAAIPAAVPSLREKAAVVLRLRSVPSEKRLAILPFRAASASEEDRALADGVSDQLTVRLTQLERFQKTFSVESTSNVRRSGVTSADVAAQALGVNLVIVGSVQRIGDRLVFVGSLEDARAGRTLRAETADSLQELLDKVVRMLDLELGVEARADLRASGTGVAEAAVLSAQALGYTPYAEGRSALERYDQSRSLERAIELFNKALEMDPNYALAHAGLGEAIWRLYLNERRPDLVPLAREHCERALALDNLLAPAWISLGVIETGTGNAEKGIAAFRHALDRDPRNATAQRELGYAYEKLGRFEEAEATYRMAIELRSDDWANYSHLGAFLVSRGRAADAEPVYRRALGIAPQNARLWSGLGTALYYRGDMTGAKAAYERSTVLFPYPVATANLATIQFYEANYADAARTLEKAARSASRSYRIWRNYAAALYWAPGERGKASAAYKKAAELAEAERKINGRDPLTLVALADCYAMLGDKVRARDLASEGLRIGPVDGPLAQMAAGVYEVIGDRPEAFRWLGEALSKGVPRSEIERDPTFSNLKADPQWAAVTSHHEGSTR